MKSAAKSRLLQKIAHIIALFAFNFTLPVDSLQITNAPAPAPPNIINGAIKRQLSPSFTDGICLVTKCLHQAIHYHTLTHWGSRYLGIRSAIALAVAGDISLGFKMTALPEYKHYRNISNPIIAKSVQRDGHDVTRGDGGEDGGQGEQEGEVPGADDEDGAVALWVDVDSIKQGHRVLIAFPF